MSKAILIVDVPDNIMFNDLFVIGEIRYTINSEYKYQYLLKEIDRCKLKPIPDPDVETIIECSKTKEEYEKYLNGWYDCVEEITGCSYHEL